MMIFFNSSSAYPSQHAKSGYESRYECYRAGHQPRSMETGDGTRRHHGWRQTRTSTGAIPVMGCYCDIIGVRSFARFENKEDDYNEVIINQFIQHSGRPVFSMEAATRHPLQSFADLITIEEYKKTARPKVVMTWAPHPKSVAAGRSQRSFAEWMNATDYDFVITPHPEGTNLLRKFVGKCPWNLIR